MKTLKATILTALTIALPFIGTSQIQLAPYAGFNFGAKTSFYQGEVRIRNAATYGINLTWLRGESGIELTYSLTSTDFEINHWDPSAPPEQQYQSSKATAHYYMIGSKSYLTDKGVLRPFLGASLGGVTFVPKNNPGDYYVLSSVTRFAFGFHGGVDVMLTEHIGLFAKIRGLVPTQWFGVGMGISCGTGGCGVGTNVSASSTFISGDVTGGLIVQLGGG